MVFIFPFLILTWGEGELPLLDSPVESGGLGIHSNLHVLEPRQIEGKGAGAGSPGWRASPHPHNIGPSSSLWTVAAFPWAVTRVKPPGLGWGSRNCTNSADFSLLEWDGCILVYLPYAYALCLA